MWPQWDNYSWLFLKIISDSEECKKFLNIFTVSPHIANFYN